MSDPTHSTDPRVEEQDGAVRDVNDPEVEQDTVSGGAPDDPGTSDEEGSADESGD
ncbi:hypothetical protein [Homoserinimonas sp. A520]